MNLTNLFKIAFKALSNNKLRGFLTMLGIIIGVGSVITMLAIGQGSKRSIQAQISEMGSNMIMIHPGGDRRGGVRLDAADMESLKLKDLEAIQTQARYISYISPSVNSSGQAIFGANNTPTTVYGISPEYLDIRRYKVEEGISSRNRTSRPPPRYVWWANRSWTSFSGRRKSRGQSDPLRKDSAAYRRRTREQRL